MEILSFIQEYWKIAVIFLIDLAILLVSIFRKRVKIVDSPKEFILRVLPGWINQAEQLYDDGVHRKSFVLSIISSLLAKEFNIQDFEPYLDFTSDAIEKILSCPQKKGE